MADHKLEIKIGNVGGTPVVFLVDSKDPTKPVSEVSVKYEDKLILTCKQDFFSGYGKTNPFDPGQRALGGGLIGAGSGAAIGGAAGGGRGAAIGAATGGAVGAITGAATTPPPRY